MSERRSSGASDGRNAVSRVEEAYRRILGLITEATLGEGDRLPSEEDMATRFGVSRPVIRQALTRLQHAGVIDVRWGSGSYVRNAASSAPSFGPVRSLNEVRQVYELRATVESGAAALAAQRRPAAALAAARQALAKLDEALAADAVGHEADLQFHFAIATASENPFFERVLQCLKIPMDFAIGLSRSLSLTHPKERKRIVQAEHIAILRAIEAGEPEIASAAMRAHLENACNRVFNGPGAAAPADEPARLLVQP
jgi:GntR family transcriptional repressor for pyruvate dehydrogenase complex